MVRVGELLGCVEFWCGDLRVLVVVYVDEGM